ncbi:MAG: DUF2306 domain-containing protein [Brevundimonas sp.]|uniref:DUF2306 domain-containing protein n=1 Tax=Brevundimonas sp. TaxID=1871086 RepID=UPI002726E474|nr:DUF2306 domain-containing protein [Brevundimonas sp.]MDO9587747.1 DUF2306 domain-containing protein [Brevundimonas sp.]
MSQSLSSSPRRGAAAGALHWSGIAWFAVAAVGQVAFIGFILAFYGVRTAQGNFAAWNDKPLIDGYIAGDHAGNFVFAAHVLLASIVTLAGLMQLTPALRRALPTLHRWTGRSFIIIGVFMALSGVWLTLVRGTSLSTISSVAILINAVLILTFAGVAWRHAVKSRFEQHRQWAMRTFMVVSGVWFLRVGIMGWVLVNQGPVGMTNTLSGPADMVLTFGSYLIPLALLELYFAAGRSANGLLKLFTAAVVFAATVFTAAGVFGTIAFMWGPYL